MLRSVIIVESAFFQKCPCDHCSADLVRMDSIPGDVGGMAVLEVIVEDGLKVDKAAAVFLSQLAADRAAALEIRQYFECYTSGEEVEHPKPAPDTFLRAMEKLNLKPEDCIIVEDSTNGGKAAAAAGAKCVWFHNPDSGDQQIPHAVLTITSWSPENVDKLIDLMHA